MSQLKKKRIVILGSTGSVGRQALDVARNFPQLVKIEGLSANTSVSEMLKQIHEFKPHTVAMSDETSAAELKRKLRLLGGRGRSVRVLAGERGVANLAGVSSADMVLTAVVGSAGILPTMAAVRAKKTIALANKEALVAAGAIVMRNRPRIIPVDSEHSAIFQCLLGEPAENLENIVLTCSGGPFRKASLTKLRRVTVRQALNHPSWKMGGKITIDSSTLMNKGFEVIEAHWLFGVPYDKIKVMVHPQSIVHSMVEFKDGSVKAQIGEPTMLVPIQLAFLFPRRLRNKMIPSLPIHRLNEMTFEDLDLKKFPALTLAYEAGRAGGTMPAALNAANEIAVEFFLQGKIKYLRIAETVEAMLAKHRVVKNPSIDDILNVDRETKIRTREYLGQV